MIDTRFPVSLHIMVILAHRQDTLVSSTDLAERLKTNPAFVRKLVANLVEAQLILSSRGKAGGLKLARTSKAITLKEIYLAATNGKQLVCVPNKTSEQSCPVSCAMGPVMAEIVEGVEHSAQSYLSQINLMDVVAKAQQ